jgi:hypothetical protein
LYSQVNMDDFIFSRRLSFDASILAEIFEKCVSTTIARWRFEELLGVKIWHSKYIERDPKQKIKYLDALGGISMQQSKK